MPEIGRESFERESAYGSAASVVSSRWQGSIVPSGGGEEFRGHSPANLGSFKGKKRVSHTSSPVISRSSSAEHLIKEYQKPAPTFSQSVDNVLMHFFVPPKPKDAGELPGDASGAGINGSPILSPTHSFRSERIAEEKEDDSVAGWMSGDGQVPRHTLVTSPIGSVDSSKIRHWEQGQELCRIEQEHKRYIAELEAYFKV